MLGATRGGIDYEWAGEIEPDGSVEEMLAEPLDELIVADGGFDERPAARDRGGRAPPRRQGAGRAADDRAADRARRVRPGQGVPLFELRPPIFAGTDWAVKRAFDIVVVGRSSSSGCRSGS